MRGDLRLVRRLRARNAGRHCLDAGQEDWGIMSKKQIMVGMTIFYVISLTLAATVSWKMPIAMLLFGAGMNLERRIRC
jgi:hypothetical protein